MSSSGTPELAKMLPDVWVMWGDRLARTNPTPNNIVARQVSLATAYFLAGCGFEVVVLEAQDHVGGRVSTDAKFIPGRLVEAGAELIGFNHAVWIGLAEVFGLGFTMCTDDKAFEQLGLASPVFLRGNTLPPDEADDVYTRMDTAFETLNVMARDVVAYSPWDSRHAETLDARSIADWKRWLQLPDLVDAAIEVVLGNDNVLPTEQQSLLGFLAQIRGGGGSRFWTDTEVMKCASGNQPLATHLAGSIDSYRHGSVRLGDAGSRDQHLARGRDRHARQRLRGRRLRRARSTAAGLGRYLHVAPHPP